MTDDEWTAGHGCGHSGNGWYAWATDYPEEGSVFLHRNRIGAEAAFAGLPRGNPKRKRRERKEGRKP